MQGIVTVLNTPFTGDDRVDFGALARHAVAAREAGVSGFLVPAMAAEVSRLTTAEREGMVRTVVEATGHAVPVIGGASAETQSERLDNAERLARLGCDVILVSQPYHSDEQYVREIAEIGSACGLDLMIQDWDAVGPGVPIQGIVAAFEAIGQLKYLKVETANSGQKYTALKQATGGRLHVSGGWAVMQLIEALDRGVDAFMPTALHHVYVAIVRHYQAGNRDGAVSLFHRVLPILAFANQNLELSIHFFKRLLWRQGVYPTPRLRDPVTLLDAYQTRRADELVEIAIALETELTSAKPGP